MKTQRRHELQTNKLADTLAHWIEAVKPYSRAVLAGLVAVVVLIFAWGYLSAESSRKSAAGWNEYFDAFAARDPREALSDVVSNYPGTEVSQWARVVQADLQLDNGTNRLFVERTDGRDELKRTIDAYRTVLLEAQQPMLLQRATFGLARAYEALGQLDEARKEYRAVVDKWPDCAYAAAATERAKDLEQAPTKSFYDWFAKYEPPRAVPKGPGIPGMRPDFMKDPLEDNSLKLPSALGDKISLPKLGNESDEAPVGEAPAAEATPSDMPPASDAPSESPPADDKPAESPDQPK